MSSIAKKNLTFEKLVKGIWPRIYFKWITDAQNADEVAREKMAKRYQEMEKRGQIGQKFGSNQKLDKAGSNQGSRSGSTKGLSSRFNISKLTLL